MKPLAFVSLAALLTGVAFAQAPKKPDPKKPPAKKPNDPKKAPEKPKIVDPLVIKITTETGSGNKWAESKSAKIYILLNGEASQKHRLAPAKGKPAFGRGAKDEFTVKADFDPAKITFVRLQNDSVDMWKCEEITLQFFKKGLASSVVKMKLGQYISTGKERKFAGAKPHIDLKMQVKLKPLEETEK